MDWKDSSRASQGVNVDRIVAGHDRDQMSVGSPQIPVRGQWRTGAVSYSSVNGQPSRQCQRGQSNGRKIV
jgi:hypothetical protein